MEDLQDVERKEEKMQWLFNSAGGRKLSVFLLGSIVLALNDVLGLGLSEETCTKIMTLGGITIGGVALEDGLKELFKKTASTKGGTK